MVSRRTWCRRFRFAAGAGVAAVACALAIAVWCSLRSTLNTPPEIVALQTLDGAGWRVIEIWRSFGMQVAGRRDDFRAAGAALPSIGSHPWSQVADRGRPGWELPRWEFGYGWPFVCLTWHANLKDHCVNGLWPRGQMIFPRSAQDESGSFAPLGVPAHAIPTRVLFGRLALNTLTYLAATSTLYGLVIWLPRVLRRSLRRRRGECAGCGYSRRGLGEAACPECGAVPGCNASAPSGAASEP